MHLIFEQYDERLRRRQCSSSALRNFARTATLFEEGGLDPLTAEDWQIEEWLAGLELASRTKRLHAENLSAAFGYAVQRRSLPTSPMDTVRLPREPDVEPHILETEELRRVLGSATTDQDWLLAHLLVYTGMRRAEVRALAWGDVALETGTLTVVRGKGGKLRKLPIHPALAEALAPNVGRGRAILHNDRTGEALGENALYNRLQRIRGGVDCSFHDFRRTVATSLVTNEVPWHIVDGIMGWAPRTVGSRYYVKKADETMQRAILRLYADDPL